MAWTTGHSESCTTTVPATSDGALSDYTMLLSHLDFPSGDRDAIADYLNAGQYEAALNSDGTTIIDVLATDIDTTANTFRLWVKYTTSAVASTDIYWRFGAAVTHTVGDQVDANTELVALLSEDFNDDSGNANNGTGNGGVSAGGVTGPDGVFAATDFDGTDDYIESTPSLPTQYTISSWIYNDTEMAQPNSRQNSYLTFAESVGDGVYDRDLAWSQSDDTFLGYHFDGDVEIAQSPAVTATGAWSHAAVTYDGSNITVYANGVAGTPTAAGNPFTGYSTPVFAIGAGQNERHDGRMSVVQLHSTARSAAWIATDHDRQGTLGQATSTALATISTGNRRRRLLIGAAA